LVVDDGGKAGVCGSPASRKSQISEDEQSTASLDQPEAIKAANVKPEEQPTTP
jgi:hypothetical protein